MRATVPVRCAHLALDDRFCNEPVEMILVFVVEVVSDGPSLRPLVSEARPVMVAFVGPGELNVAAIERPAVEPARIAAALAVAFGLAKECAPGVVLEFIPATGRATR